MLHTKNRKEEPVWQNFITFVVIHGCCSNDCPVLLQGQAPYGALWGWKVPRAGLFLPPTARTWAFCPTAFKIKNPEAFDFWWKARSFPPCSCKSNVSVAMWRYLCSYLLVAGRFYFWESFSRTAGASGFQSVLLQHALLFQNEKVKRLLSG